MKSRINTKYFPFSPGIPWKVLNGKYVIPEIDYDTWKTAVENRDLVVVAHGGLLESFASLSIVEALRRLEPSKKILWAGRDTFKGILRANGLAQYLPLPNISANYPVPLFFDDNNRAYINALHNYLTKYSYYGKHAKSNNKPVFEQIYTNSLLPWNNRYVPSLSFDSSIVDSWAKSVKFQSNKKYIVVIPGPTGFSHHTADCLPWDSRSLREFSSILKRFDTQIVLCTGDRTNVYNAAYYQAPRTLEFILSIMQNASMILSSDIDFLLIGLATSNASVISPISYSKEFDLYSNAEFIGAENVIFTTDTMTPIEVYTMCEGIL